MKTKELGAMLQEAATARYGENIPAEVSTRLREELDFIQSQKIEEEFIRACDITNKLRQHHIPWIIADVAGGSSLIAFLLGITQVNPLPPHYYCPKCKKVEFVSDVNTGFDLSGKICTSCGAAMIGDGHRISFSWFVDSACSFSEYPQISEYRVPALADTVIEELSSICALPIFYDEYDKLTEYKQRILFVPFTALMHLQQLCRKTGIAEESIPANDTKALRCLFESLGKEEITESDLIYDMDWLYNAREENDQVRQELRQESAKNASVFSDLVQLSGLYHMTLDEEYKLPPELWAVFCDRESVLEYFYRLGIPTEIAFNFARNICKGRHTEEIQKQLKSLSVDPMIIEAAAHIFYLFPRTFNISYCMLHARLAWFSLHYPDEYRQVIKGEYQ